MFMARAGHDRAAAVSFGSYSIAPGGLMNSTVVRRSNVMEYRDQEIRYDAETLFELESDYVRRSSESNEYRQKRSIQPKRRKSPKAAHPGCGMGGRRNRHWNW
jgi:hypothetical protein